ncbi:hypothetical protein M427DRAFT_47521 [Gonapodya prolifera JEL478]|uniref:Uncharacterized protein n=1 Tax=Gonapodya prolifera (strain JEL478) TaxID=1344416 RepID=A0A139A3Q5_GONPJ|nr:hypothetical protein M427DRAFT_47521 [Gonapodya prolifera JEL478]|eukprot:KXS11105.1 hypothetical protein M427DRAFT_47521 [Gonapodya prolifera JEL478]
MTLPESLTPPLTLILRVQLPALERTLGDFVVPADPGRHGVIGQVELLGGGRAGFEGRKFGAESGVPVEEGVDVGLGWYRQGWEVEYIDFSATPPPYTPFDPIPPNRQSRPVVQHVLRTNIASPYHGLERIPPRDVSETLQKVVRGISPFRNVRFCSLNIVAGVIPAPLVFNLPTPWISTQGGPSKQVESGSSTRLLERTLFCFPNARFLDVENRNLGVTSFLENFDGHASHENLEILDLGFITTLMLECCLKCPKSFSEDVSLDSANFKSGSMP